MRRGPGSFCRLARPVLSALRRAAMLPGAKVWRNANRTKASAPAIASRAPTRAECAVAHLRNLRDDSCETGRSRTPGFLSCRPKPEVATAMNRGHRLVRGRSSTRPALPGYRRHPVGRSRLPHQPVTLRGTAYRSWAKATRRRVKRRAAAAGCLRTGGGGASSPSTAALCRYRCPTGSCRSPN